MKKIGIVLLVFAALNLLVAIIASVSGETYAAGSKFSSALLLGAIGGLLYYFGDKKETSNQESISRSSTLKYASVQDENFWQRYKRLNPTKACAIESITGRNMAMQSDKDAQELVSSMERWAKIIGCQINGIKTEFLQSYQSAFDNADTKEILEHLKNVKLREEANRFNISMQNTCTHFMIKWLTEYLRKESPQPANNQMKTRNKMSARDLVISENASLEFRENPNTGKIFFICGSKKGYVSPAAVEKMETGSIDDFYYVEVSVGGKDYVPCLCYAKSANVIKQFDATTHNTSKLKERIRTKLRNAFREFIEDAKKEDTYNKMEDPVKYLILKTAVANFYQQMQHEKSLVAMSNLYQIDYNTLLDEECMKIMEEVETEFFNNTDPKEEIGNKPDDDLPF